MKGFVNNFSHTSSPNIWRLFGLFGKNPFFILTAVATLGENLATFNLKSGHTGKNLTIFLFTLITASLKCLAETSQMQEVAHTMSDEFGQAQMMQRPNALSASEIAKYLKIDSHELRFTWLCC